MFGQLLRRAMVGGIVVAVLAAPVAAQPAPAPVPGALAKPGPTPAPAPGPKPGHPAIALGLSLATPVLVFGSAAVFGDLDTIGVPLLVAGLAVAPAAGWFYAQRPWHGAATSLLRLVGGAVVISAFDYDDDDPSNEVVTACALVVLGTTVYDLLGPATSLSADRARWRERRALVVPTATGQGAGLALVGSF